MARSKNTDGVDDVLVAARALYDAVCPKLHALRAALIACEPVQCIHDYAVRGCRGCKIKGNSCRPTRKKRA